MTATRLTDRSVIRLSSTETGEDVRAFLQGLVTQDMNGPLPAWAGLLSPQGKALFDFFLWADGDAILIDCEAAQADALVRRLSLYRLRRKIMIAVDGSLAVYWSLGEPDQAAEIHGADITTALDPRHIKLGYRWLSASIDALAEGSQNFRAHRLSLGITEGAAELGNDQTLWLEANAAELNGVSFNKGCYVGQENTARMNWRQKVNRRLVVVPLADADAKRQRVAYPEFGVSVELRRVEDIAGLELPEWQRAAIS
jgi:folate-binding protein YgfZ